MNHHRVAIVLASALLVACSQSLHLKTTNTVPAPLINQYPVSVGIYFTDEFRNFIYREDSPDRPDWRIESGASQVQAFNHILSFMFQSVQEVDSIKASSLTATLKPTIEEIQIAMPEDTKTKLYEVWIKCRMELFDADGKIITDWPIIGYGKSSVEFLVSRSDGLNAAFGQALRDTGASLILKFTKDDRVKGWLTDLGVCNPNDGHC